MAELTLNEKIELLAQDMADRYGMPIERARAILHKAMYEDPPTSEEIAEAIDAAAR